MSSVPRALSFSLAINEAIRQFETALRIKPGYLDARQNLERTRKAVPAAGSPH